MWRTGANWQTTNMHVQDRCKLEDKCKLATASKQVQTDKHVHFRASYFHQPYIM